jgi:hypothetical protein
VTDALLPAQISPRLCAALLGRSLRSIYRMIDTGELAAAGNVWRKVELSSVERVRQSPITIQDFLAASKRLEPARARQRAYNTTRRTCATAASATHNRGSSHDALLPGGSDKGKPHAKGSPNDHRGARPKR